MSRCNYVDTLLNTSRAKECTDIYLKKCNYDGLGSENKKISFNFFFLSLLFRFNFFALLGLFHFSLLCLTLIRFASFRVSSIFPIRFAYYSFAPAENERRNRFYS
jgi:hypothetical protein